MDSFLDTQMGKLDEVNVFEELGVLSGQLKATEGA
jgi:hypothetical protein